MMAKWFIHCVLTVVCLSATPALSDKFTAVKDMKYHIISRAQSIFTASSLSHIRKFNDSRTPRDFVYENQFNFDPVRPTRIFVHGFYSDMTLMDSYAKSYLDIGDFNFIAVDWLAGARTLNYPVARHRVREVGEALAVFIDHLVEVMGMNLEDLILVGHSLGAHICGWAGKSVTSGKLPVIIGLDPALPLFSLKHSKHRLAYTDARYVQIIHTCGGRLGIKHSIGHADFYPNFGRHQPGCTGLTSGRFHPRYVLCKNEVNSFCPFQMCARTHAFTIYFKRACEDLSGPRSVRRILRF